MLDMKSSVIRHANTDRQSREAIFGEASQKALEAQAAMVSALLTNCAGDGISPEVLLAVDVVRELAAFVAGKGDRYALACLMIAQLMEYAEADERAAIKREQEKESSTRDNWIPSSTSAIAEGRADSDLDEDMRQAIKDLDAAS